MQTDSAYSFGLHGLLAAQFTIKHVPKFRLEYKIELTLPTIVTGILINQW